MSASIAIQILPKVDSTVTTANRMARYFLKFFFIGNSSLNFDYLDLR